MIEDNKLIAEFIHLDKEGDEYYIPEYNSGEWYSVDEMEFHESWDWLMPVVEKIESLGFEFFIVENRCKVKRNTDKSIEVLSYLEGGDKLSITYQTVVEFIKWYNENKGS